MTRHMIHLAILFGVAWLLVDLLRTDRALIVSHGGQTVHGANWGGVGSSQNPVAWQDGLGL